MNDEQRRRKGLHIEVKVNSWGVAYVLRFRSGAILASVPEEWDEERREAYVQEEVRQGMRRMAG